MYNNAGYMALQKYSASDIIRVLALYWHLVPKGPPLPFSYLPDAVQTLGNTASNLLMTG